MDASGISTNAHGARGLPSRTATIGSRSSKATNNAIQCITPVFAIWAGRYWLSGNANSQIVMRLVSGSRYSWVNQLHLGLRPSHNFVQIARIASKPLPLHSPSIPAQKGRSRVPPSYGHANPSASSKSLIFSPSAITSATNRKYFPRSTSRSSIAVA